MSTQHYNYRDNDFRFEQAGDYTLLLQIAPASFSYAITLDKKLLIFEEEHPLNELNNDGEGDLLSQRFKKVVIGLPVTGFSLVPVSLFNAGKAAEFARFLDVKPGEKVFAQHLNAENEVIYKVDGTIAGLIDAKLETGEIVFSATGWITAQEKNIAAGHLYLNISGDKAELIYFKDAKLRFYNSFEFKNPDELVYFVSVVAVELQLDPHNIALAVSGAIKADDRNAKRLAEFFDRVELNSLQILELPAQIDPHAVLALTALYLCGSSEED